MAGKDRVVVTFDNSIRFVPPKSKIIYRIQVILGKAQQLSYNTFTNTDEPDQATYQGLHIPNEASRMAIAFVLDSIEASEEIGSIPGKELTPDSTMTIMDKSEVYEVSVDSPSIVSSYKVKKGSGEILGPSHRHKRTSPSIEKLIEITE